MKLILSSLLAVAFVLAGTFNTPSGGTISDAKANDFGLCIDPESTFYPLVIGDCRFAPKDHTDALLIVGRVILEADYPPAGTIIEAISGGQMCGTTTTTGGRAFDLLVLGAGEREGCAEPGQEVEFRVGGVTAGQRILWREENTFPRFLSLSAIEQHAWYWTQRVGVDLPSEGTSVQAVVGSVVCGEADFSHDPGSFPFVIEDIAGFSQLVVPSDSVQPGCGQPGEDVTFIVDGIEAWTSEPWEPGVHYIELAVPGDVNCNLAVQSIDANLILQLGAGLIEALACPSVADVSRDSQTNAIDAALVLQFVAGLIDYPSR